MFKIVDGREYFYQWDLDRQVAVEDSSIVEVHFCNRTDDCSLVVEVVEGVANVPNIILQKSFDVRVFGYDGKATRYDEVFKVKPRTKPSDYVYTEVEIKNYNDLEARIDEIEKNGISEEVITAAVEGYLEKNPVDLEGYATEDYVDEAVKNVQVDLTGYATEAYVGKAIENIEIPTKTSQLTNDSNYLTSVPSEYITESELRDKGYITAAAVSNGYFPKSSGQQTQAEIAAVDARVDAIEAKASKYLTSIPAEYITESELNAKGYATKKYVDDAIAGIEIPEGGGDADLTNYYTKEEVDNAIYNSKDTYYLDFSNATEEAQAATADMIEFITRFIEGQNVCAHIRGPEKFANAIKGWQPTTVQKVINKYIFTANTINPQQIAGDNVTPYYSFELKEDSTAGWVYYTKNTYTFAIATKEYVDGLFANIATAEGGAY